MDFPWAEATVPFVDTAQMIEVDRAMIEDFHIELIQMMENAGRNLAHLARERFLTGEPRKKSIVVLAGTGGNGGGALVAARRLHNYGAAVQVFITKSDSSFTPVPKHQLDIVRQMEISVGTAADLADSVSPDLILDGIIGYSLQGAPRNAAALLIQWANAQAAPILALDAPSGLDTTSGTVYQPTIQAAATMTLALPKAGLMDSSVAAQVGELYMADISVPPQLYASPALQLQVEHLFARSDIIRLK